MTDWQKKIKDNKTLVGVLGLGYVGLPLVREFGSAGFKVLGFDIDQSKTEKLNAGKSIIKHIPDSQIKSLVKDGLFEATIDMSRIAEVDALLICVPTPLTDNREPDVQYISKSSETIAEHLKPG